MRYFVSLIEQGLGSVLTFGVNLWLIRNGAEASYGVYVFWYAVAWMLGTLQGTLAITHLYKLPAARDGLAARAPAERFLLTVMLTLCVLAALAVLAGNAALAAHGSSLAEPGAALFIPAFLLFQYVRAFAFSRQRPAAAAVLSATVLAGAALLLGADFALGRAPNAGRVLTLVGLAYAAPALAVLLILLRGLRPMLGVAALRRQAHILAGSGWLLLGAGSGEVTSRLYSFAVVARYGSEALGALAAVQVVIRPAWMLSAAWTSIGFPAMAGAWARRDRGAVLRAMLAGAAVTTIASLSWSLVVLAAWPWISATLYHGRYADPGWLVVLWGANVMLGSIAVALNTAMLSLGEFRRLAVLDLVAAVVVVVALATLLPRGSPWAIGATLLGQAAQIVLMAALLRRQLRRRLGHRPEHA